MTDFIGNELQVGDCVAVAMCGGSYATYLKIMEIVGFCKRSGYECVKLIPINPLNKYTKNVFPIVKAKHKIMKLSK